MLTIFSCPKHPSQACPDSPLFFRVLLHVSVAVLCPLATHDLTYGTGLNLARGGPTRFRKSKDDMVDVSKEAGLGVQIKFIWENLHSHSALAMGMLLTATSNQLIGGVFPISVAYLNWRPIYTRAVLEAFFSQPSDVQLQLKIEFHSNCESSQTLSNDVKS